MGTGLSLLQRIKSLANQEWEIHVSHIYRDSVKQTGVQTRLQR